MFKWISSLHKKILTSDQFKPKEDLILYLGDYIDRGQKSKQVIDQIIKLKDNKIKTITLIGNHEELMIDFLFNKKNNVQNWLNFGADQTFKSYGIEIVEFNIRPFGRITPVVFHPIKIIMKIDSVLLH